MSLAVMTLGGCMRSGYLPEDVADGHLPAADAQVDAGEQAPDAGPVEVDAASTDSTRAEDAGVIDAQTFDVASPDLLAPADARVPEAATNTDGGAGLDSTTSTDGSIGPGSYELACDDFAVTVTVPGTSPRSGDLFFLYAGAVRIQTDDKIVISVLDMFAPVLSFNSFIMRFTAAGLFDSSFADQGLLPVNPGGADWEAMSVELTPADEIVAGGTYQPGDLSRLAAARITGAGVYDSSFGIGGAAIVGLGLADRGTSVALQTDGAVLVSGGAGGDAAVARFTSAGVLDTSFGGSGVATVTFARDSIANDVAVQSDGKIVIVGEVGRTGSTEDFMLARFNPDGTPDPAFGVAGQVTTELSSDDNTAYSLVLQQDGMLVVAGTADDGNGAEFVIARYSQSGALDPGFGTGGWVNLAPLAISPFSAGLALRGDGKILVVGGTGLLEQELVTIMQLMPSGALDPSFATGGVYTQQPVGTVSYFGTDLDIAGDGSFVVLGSFSDSTSQDMGISLLKFSAAGVPTPWGCSAP